MRLADTGHRLVRRKRPERGVAAAWIGILLVVTLAACTTGEAEDARVAATREATRGAVLPDVQATNIVKEFFPPTASPAPTETPFPSIGTLALATSVDSSNRPSNETGVARQGSTIYAVANLSDVRAGEVVTAIWSTGDGAEMGRTTVDITRSDDSTWVALRWDVPTGIPTGSYSVYVYVDDRLMNSLVFSMSG